MEKVVEHEHQDAGEAPPAPAPAASTSTSPADVRAVLGHLAQLRVQLADPSSKAAREHWRHQALYDALVLTVAALGRAHPGGLPVLSGDRRVR
ncbi:MAG: hypothetical protein HOV94_05345 [Saccharothrix sp.]|nr:hypothetical protein [Saccharothrix sp.]